MKRCVLALAMVMMLAGACKPSPGGSCKVDTKEVCIDDKRALACHDGTWEEMSCRGAAGCTKTGSESECDQSVADRNDVCNLEADFVCSADKKVMLQCTKNKWTVALTCQGDRGCVMEKKKVTCDNSLASVGEPCREDDDYACSLDKKAALACKKGQFAQTNLCKGPRGCRVTGTKDQGFKVECDDSVASAGDACEREDHFSCAADERAILKCRSKRFDVEEKCRAKEKCQIRGGQVGCY